jgi:hypothetical protein
MKLASCTFSIFLFTSWALAQASKRCDIVFEDIRPRSGVDFVLDNSATPEKHQPETMIAGVAVFDYNNDNLQDIFFVNGAKLLELNKSDPKFWNRLYRNNGNGTFTDVTVAAGVKGVGYGMGVSAGDYDNDGWVDLYLAGVDKNQLLHNNGDGTFSDVTEKAHVQGMIPGFGKGFGISAGWFDYDNDGLLDLFVCNYIRWIPEQEHECRTAGLRGYCTPEAYEGEPSILYHNNGDGAFADVSEKSGIGLHIGKGMAVTFADFDDDGYPDVFMSNDTVRNFLFHNKGNGNFDEIGLVAGVSYNDSGRSIAGMGADFRDVDNDGRPDLFVVAMFGDTFPLFRNAGRHFEDITLASGISRATIKLTAWGAGMYDFDNDGWKDLLATTGSVLDNSESVEGLPSKLPNLLLQDLGGRRFDEVSANAGPAFGRPKAHRGVAFADLNNDGKIDAVVTCLNEHPEIWINRSPEPNHWLMLKLIGTRSNRQAIGAKIKLTPDSGAPQYNHVTTSVGFSSSSDERVHFGLGKSTRAKAIEITWPSGTKQTLADVHADQILTITEPR